MNEQSNELPQVPRRREKALAWAKEQRFGLVALVLGVVVVAALPQLGPAIRSGVRAARGHLALSLPILMVLISIGVRIHELVQVKGWLALCNRFASGVVTFAIWAMVSGASVKQFIWINEQKVLDKDYAVILVVSAFGLMIVCSLATVLAEQQGLNPHKHVWQALQAVFVAVSLIALVAPYYLFEDKSAVEARTGKSLELRAFTVAVGYRDAAFNQYIGRSANPVQQCAILRSVAAKGALGARSQALKSFLESDLSNQFVPASERTTERAPRKVEVESTWIVAEAEAEENGGP